MSWTRVSGLLTVAVLRLGHETSPPIVPIPLTLTLGAPSVVGGNATTATIALSVAAPSGGTIVTITNPAGTTIQAGASQAGGIQSIGSTKVSIVGGQRQVTVNVLTAGVAASSVLTITASSGTDVAAGALVVTPAKPRAVIAAAASVIGGQNESMTILLDGAAPSGTGLTVSLAAIQSGGSTSSASDGSVRTITPGTPGGATVPATVSFSPGSSSMTVSVATTAVARDQVVSVVASAGGASTSTTFTIKAPVPSQIQLAPTTVVEGNSATGTIVLSGPAPSGGMSVFLSTNNRKAAMPGAVVVPAGATVVAFPIVTGVTADKFSSSAAPTGGTTTVVVTARQSPQTVGSFTDGTSNTIQLSEAASAPSATLTILPPVLLQSASVDPVTVAGGDPFTLSLVFTAPPIPLTAGASSVSLGTPAGFPAGSAAFSSDHPELLRLPATVAISSGAGTVTTIGTTSAPSADVTVTVRVTFGDKTVAAKLLVTAPQPAIESFSIRPTTVTGGNNVIGSIKLAQGTTPAKVVTLSTDRPDVVQVPASVTVAASAVPQPFTFKTQPVTTQTSATITATVGNQRLIMSIVVIPSMSVER